MSTKAAVVYTQAGCQPCKAAIRWLERNGAPVVVKELNEGLRERFRRAGHLQSPVIELWESTEYGWEIEEVISGYKPEKLKAFFL